MRNWKWYVYILECKNGFYYTGITWNIEVRMEQHRLGKGSKFTARYGFKELKWFEEFDNLAIARERENQVKDFSRKKKEALWKNKEAAFHSHSKNNYSSNDSEKLP